MWFNFLKRRAKERFPQTYYPFHDGLLEQMDAKPNFLKSLKLNNPKRFVFIPVIFTSYPNANDEVVGLWYLDKVKFRKGQTPLFKQDFIVNVGMQYKTWHSYTTKEFIDNDTVFLIDDFFRIYGNNGSFYHNGKKWQHHYDKVSDLPDEPNLQALAIMLMLLNKSND